MAKLIHVSESSRSAYDRFIQSMPTGSFRQGYAWGDVMSYDQDVFRIAIEREGRIVAAMSLQQKRLPFLPLSLLYAPRGPIVDYSDVEAIELLLAEVSAIARRGNSVFLRIDPDFLDDDQSRRQALIARGFIHLEGKDWSSFNYPRVLMRLDITPAEDVLLGNLRKKHRQHINSLQSKGIVISTVSDRAGLRRFYGLMKELSVRKGFHLRSYEYYERLVHGFGDDVRVLLASHGDQVLAGVLSLMYGNKCWYMHGATIEGKGNLHPAEGLHWAVIRWARSRGAVFYDFGGTGTEYPPREDNPNFPLYHFKKGFGAEIHYLTGYYDLPFKPVAYRLFRFVEEEGLELGTSVVAAVKRRLSHQD